MEELIINKIKSEINRFDEILQMEDKDNRTLQSYKNNYKIIKEYLEDLLVDIQKVINNPIVIKKYNKKIEERCKQMNIEEVIERLSNAVAISKFETKDYPNCIVMKQDIKTLLTAYEKEKEKNKELIKQHAIEITDVGGNSIKIDLDGKIHNVYKIEEE